MNNEDYLWDRSGPPDPEIVELENTLAPLRYRHREPKPRRALWPVAAIAMAAAAAVLLMVTPKAPAPETDWQIAGAKLRQGQTLRTGNAPVVLESTSTGRVDLAPHSELTAADGKRLSLNRGELHAFIWAPAREFVVDTPSARAVDLGCEYTLNVDQKGDGLLRVKMGWVAFQHDGHDSFIPAGAQCVTRRKSGPGIPYYEDAPDPLKQSVAAWERGEMASLNGILTAARPRDGITLWHLITRVSPSARGPVFDRFQQLVELPKEVTRDQILAGNAKAIDLCWNALNLENTSWWRGWERNWDR